MNQVIEQLSQYQNFVLLGEAGSGKSELALNLAETFAEAFPEREVHLFDLDQTKPHFRSREAAGSGFTIHWQEQIMDSPTLVGGVEDGLLDPGKIALLDVGGGEMGARLIGQFRELLSGGETLVLYLINPYRPWSGTKADLAITMQEVLGNAGVHRRLGKSGLQFVANPNVGPDTEEEDVLEGLRRLRENLGVEPSWLVVQEALAGKMAERVELMIYPVRIRLATSSPEQLYQPS